MDQIYKISGTGEASDNLRDLILEVAKTLNRQNPRSNIEKWLFVTMLQRLRSKEGLNFSEFEEEMKKTLGPNFDRMKFGNAKQRAKDAYTDCSTISRLVVAGR